jgi:hypothetical protein
MRTSVILLRSPRGSVTSLTVTDSDPLCAKKNTGMDLGELERLYALKTVVARLKIIGQGVPGRGSCAARVLSGTCADTKRYTDTKSEPVGSKTWELERVGQAYPVCPGRRSLQPSILNKAAYDVRKTYDIAYDVYIQYRIRYDLPVLPRFHSAAATAKRRHFKVSAHLGTWHLRICWISMDIYGYVWISMDIYWPQAEHIRLVVLD